MATREERLALREALTGGNPIEALEELIQESYEEVPEPVKVKVKNPMKYEWGTKIRDNMMESFKPKTSKAFQYDWGTKAGTNPDVNIVENTNSPEPTIETKKVVEPGKHKVI